MNPRGNPAPLAEARRRHSLDKRARVLTVLAALEKQGQPLTFAAVARAARVSTWLAYAPGVREHIEAAQLRQAHSTSITAAGSTPNPRSLRTELEIARQEIKALRASSSMPSIPLPQRPELTNWPLKTRTSPISFSKSLQSTPQPEPA